MTGRSGTLEARERVAWPGTEREKRYATGGGVQELNKIRVTWQLGVMLCAVPIVLVAGVALVSVLIEPGQSGDRGVKIVCGTALFVGVLLSVVAVLSRLASAFADERATILRRIGLGVLVIGLAAGITFVSYFFGTFSALGSQWHLVPTGIYVVGLSIIVRAMVDERE
jgi:hypothetical protein